MFALTLSFFAFLSGSVPAIKFNSSPVTIKQNEDLIAEGDKNCKENNYDAAVKNYQDALQLVPNDAVTLLKLGYILAQS